MVNMNLSRKNHLDFYPTYRPSDGCYSTFSDYTDNYPHRNYRNNKKAIEQYDNSQLLVSGDGHLDRSGHTLMQTISSLATDYEFLSEMRRRYPVSVLRNMITCNSFEAMRWNYRNAINRFDKAKYPASYFLSDRRKGFDELDMSRRNSVYTVTDKRQLANTGLPRNPASDTIPVGSNAFLKSNFCDNKQYFSEKTYCDRFENVYNEGNHSYSVCPDKTGSQSSRNKLEDIVKRCEEGKDFMEVKRKRKHLLDSFDVIDLTCDPSDLANNKRVKMLDTSILTDNKLVKSLDQESDWNIEVNHSVDTLNKTDSNTETKYYAPYEDYDTGFEEVYEDSLLAKHIRYYQNITKQHKTCDKNGEKYKQVDDHFKLESRNLALPAHINYCNDDTEPTYTDEDNDGDEESPFIVNPEFGGGNTDEQYVAVDYSMKSKTQKCSDTCSKKDEVDPSINSGREPTNVGPRDFPTDENSESQERITASASAPDKKLDESDGNMPSTAMKSLSDFSSNNLNKSLIEFVLSQNNLGSGKRKSSLVNSLAKFGCCLLLSQSKGKVSENRNQECSRNCSDIEANGCVRRSCTEIKDNNSKSVVQKAVRNTFGAEQGKMTRKEKKTLGEVFDSMITDMVNEDTY